jgi:NADPH-dependent 2,4-dienoyl-CoA reductase/sulfur reductase-like enzyme
MSLDRRSFLKLAAGTGLFALSPAAVHAAEALGKGKHKPRVVVIGGGYGGATCSKYLRMWSNNAVEVVMVERQKQFISCPMSNTVLGGSRTMADITHTYDALSHKWGVNRVEAEVTAIDPAKKTIRTARGALPYDRLVLAPGIDFLYNEIEGTSHELAETTIPHAWKAGPQTALLRKQLESMPDGGVYVLAIPKAPYRCPPGPYERVCQVAFYLKNHKPKSKIIVLDANPDITSKKGLFMKAWNELYPGMIDYRPNARAVRVEAANRVVHTEFDTVKGDVLNIVPPMRAGKVADLAGVVTADNRWCGVDFLSFESTAQPGIHIIGDAVSSGLPKSGHMANTQAKVAAAAIIELLAGNQPDPEPVLGNTCYSMVSDKEAMHVANVFKYDKEKKQFVAAPGGGVSDKHSETEGTYAKYWAQNIWADVLK